MKTTGFQASRLGRPVPRPSWSAGKWASLVTASVHAPVAAFRTAPGNLTAVVNSKFGDTLPSIVSASVSNLWVENGVIWQLPNLLVGFTSYSAATGFFSSVKGLGYESAPSSWYEGTPFSASDFPILHFGKKCVEINGFILVWPSLNTMTYAKTFLPMLPVNQPLIPSLATSAGPVVPTSAMENFSANSPAGCRLSRPSISCTVRLGRTRLAACTRPRPAYNTT